MFFILITMVISIAPLYDMKAQIQRDLDHATRAAAVQIDMQELSLGQIVFNEASLIAAFDQHFAQYEVRDRQLDLNTEKKILTSMVTVVILYKPWFFGTETELVIPRTSSVQVFFPE